MKVCRLVGWMWPGPGCFPKEVPPAEDGPKLLELDRAAELYRKTGIPWPTAWRCRATVGKPCGQSPWFFEKSQPSLQH